MTDRAMRCSTLLSAQALTLVFGFVVSCVSLSEASAQYNNIYGESQQQYLRDYDKRRAAQARGERTRVRRAHTAGLPSESGRGEMRFQPEAPREGLSAALVLIGPTDKIYSRFGHITLRITSGQRDLLYDLGLGRSGASDLSAQIWGSAEFTGRRESFQKALARWRRADRDVTVYPLRLGAQDVTALYHEVEARVDGRSPPYSYDPLRENCSTQLRQVLDSITQGLISRVGKRTPSPYSFRDEVKQGYAQSSLLLTMIQIWGGISLDRSRDMWEMSAIPARFIDLLKHIGARGDSLMEPGRALYRRRASPATGGLRRHLPTLWMTLIGLLFCAPFVMLYRAPGLGSLERSRRLIRAVLLAGTILLGLSVVFSLCLTVNSQWLELRNSWALYLGSPLDVMLLFITAHSSLSRLKMGRLYLIIRGGVTLAMLAYLYLSMSITPPLALMVLMVSAWLACFGSLRSLESHARREDYERSLEGDQFDDISWSRSEPTDVM